MAATAKQIEIQVRANYRELVDTYKSISNLPAGDANRARMERRVQLVEREQARNLRNYRKLTGQGLHYEIPLAPVTLVGDVEKIRRNHAAHERRQEQNEDRRLASLISRGRMTTQELQSGVESAYNTAHNSDFANLIFSHWVRMCGGANPHTLIALRDMALPSARRALHAAEAARLYKDFAEAEMHLKSAAETIKRVGNELTRFNNMIESGGRQAEMYIKFYRDVTIAAVTGGSNLSLGVGHKVAVAAVGATADQTTELTTKALGGEKVTSKDFIAAAVEIGTASASPYVGGKINVWFGGMAKRLGGRIAAKAVDRYVGPALGPKQRAAAIKAATKAVEDRISALGSSQFAKIANKLAKEGKEPDWNWWENVIAPMVGGDLGGIITEAAREAESSKQAAAG